MIESHRAKAIPGLQPVQQLSGGLFDGFQGASAHRAAVVEHQGQMEGKPFSEKIVVAMANENQMSLRSVTTVGGQQVALLEGTATKK